MQASRGVTDWAAIARKIAGRSAVQCRNHWNDVLDPAINKGPWTPAEDRRLEKLQRELGCKWMGISEGMPGRTAPQCTNRWRRLCAIKAERDRERSMLGETTRKRDGNARQGDTSPMRGGADAASKPVEDGDGADAREQGCGENGRSSRKGNRKAALKASPTPISKTRRRGWLSAIRKQRTWTVDEDHKLLHLHDTHGKNWARIAQDMDGRSEHQCRGRWLSSREASVANGPWTQSEDEALIRLHVEYGGSEWARISPEIGGQTGSQCRFRWIYVLDPSVRRYL